MNRRRRLLAVAFAFPLSGCILDFENLSGGEGGGGGSGGSAACPDCRLCEGACEGGACDAILDLSAGSTSFRVAVVEGALFAGDPASKSLVRLTEGGQPAVFEVPTSPQAIAADDRFVFWGTEGDGMFRCEKADCAKLVELLPGGTDSNPRQLLVDGGELYWVTGPDLTAGKVLRCDVNACVPQAIATDQFRPHGLALDAQYVYWTVHGMDGTLDGSIMRARRDGTEVVTYLANVDGPSGVAVAGDSLYYTHGVYDGRVLRCALGPTACGAPEEITPAASLAGAPVRVPMSVAAAGEWVYWTNDGDNTVMACPTAGCATTSDGLPIIVGAGLMAPGGLAATSGCAFWTAGGGVFGASRP